MNLQTRSAGRERSFSISSMLGSIPAFEMFHEMANARDMLKEGRELIRHDLHGAADAFELGLRHIDKAERHMGRTEASTNDPEHARDQRKIESLKGELIRELSDIHGPDSPEGRALEKAL